VCVPAVVPPNACVPEPRPPTTSTVAQATFATAVRNAVAMFEPESAPRTITAIDTTPDDARKALRMHMQVEARVARYRLARGLPDEPEGMDRDPYFVGSMRLLMCAMLARYGARKSRQRGRRRSLRRHHRLVVCRPRHLVALQCLLRHQTPITSARSSHRPSLRTAHRNLTHRQLTMSSCRPLPRCPITTGQRAPGAVPT
jgi:hypothetical protein